MTKQRLSGQLVFYNNVYHTILNYLKEKKMTGSFDIRTDNTNQTIKA
jgi:hypothetical protein